MNPVSIRSCLSATAVWIGAAVATGQPIDVPNHSFEAPDVVFADYPIADWQKSGPVNTVPNPFGGTITGQTDTGVFENVPFTYPDENNLTTIAGMDGTQGGFIFDIVNPQEPIAIFQTLVEPYAVGRQYVLTVGVAKSVSEFAPPMPDGAALRISLYFLDGPDRVVVDSVDVTGAELSGIEMRDFGFTTAAVGAGDAWAGQPIGIAFDPLTGSYGTFDVDNVRLTAVPEPATMVLFGPVGLALLRRRRRR